MADDSGNIKVVVRCRPLNTRELSRGAIELIRMDGNQTILEPPESSEKTRLIEKKTHTFTFDKSYWSAGSRDDPKYCSQQTLYDDLGKELLDHSFGGFNACILAYGQTGSGKSYSMMGYGADKGIIPLTCMELFARTESKMAADANTAFTVEVSYIEIYNEKVRDLLNPKNKGNLKVREHPSLGPYVEDLSKLVVGSYSEMMTLMDEGNKARTVAATNMNETSSRSHAVFTLLLTQRRHDVETHLDTEKVSRINLVDLAGSERANSTGATGQRLKEGANINKSLTTLGKVISALAVASEVKPKRGKGKADEFVPYRDSVLTWLLKDSLGGNSKTAMIAAISPADYEETLSTLRYADQAKKIKNKAVVNEDPNAKLVRELKEELEMLRARVANADGQGFTSEANYDPSVPPEKQMVTYRTKDGQIKKVSKAELQEQLETSEKLMRDLNETWEEKMERTHEVQKEREQALAELGITIEKNMIGVHMPKKMPHLVNLNEDPLMSECLIYQLKPGKSVVGRLDSKNAVIKLSGDTILDDHCFFESVDGKVVIVAMHDSPTFLNGKQIQPNVPHKLRSGYRVILGSHHVFRFNNPEEYRKRRERHKSNLNHSLTLASQLENPPRTPSTRPDSPTSSVSEADVDWTYACREAALARLGMDPTLDNIPDEDLNKLYDRISKLKILRDHGQKSRPESSLSHIEDPWTWSDSGRLLTADGYTDETSLDNGGSRDNPEFEDSVREVQGQLEQQRVEFEARLSAIAESSEAEDLKMEKEYMEARLKNVQSQMKRLIELHTRGLRADSDAEAEPVLYSARQLRLIRKVVNQWKSHRSFSMSETVLTHASLLKEANILSLEQSKNVVYNFSVAAGGSLTNPTSNLESIAGVGELGDMADPVTQSSTQPSVVVKVLDKQHTTVYTWSLQRMLKQIQRMRGLSMFSDRPAYSRHFASEEPFYNSPPPRYSFIGNALISLSRLAKRCPSTSTVPIFCRYTSEAIGSCRVDIKIVNMDLPARNGTGSVLSTRSSSPMLPIHPKLGFILTVDTIRGLSPHEFASVHLQVRLSSFTGTVTDADELYSSTSLDLEKNALSTLKFRRSFSIVVNSKAVAHMRNGYVPIEFFAEVKTNYLQRLESWDEMREHRVTQVGNSLAGPSPSKNSPAASLPPMRRSETELIQEQTHNILACIAICELGPDGKYLQVPIISTGELDPGCFQLHQGLQRRLVLRLTSNSGRQFPWDRVLSLSLGNVRFLDGRSQLHESPAKHMVELNTGQEQVVEYFPDGTSSLTVESTWDSSAHESVMLNRVTGANQRILIQMQWFIAAENCLEPIRFSIDISVAMRPRDAGKPSKLLSYFNSTTLLKRCWYVFHVRLTPPLTRSLNDLWRLDTSGNYVQGEDKLTSWRARGVSVVQDFERLLQTERRAADVQATRAMLASAPIKNVSMSGNRLDSLDHDTDLLRRSVKLWRLPTPQTLDLNNAVERQPSVIAPGPQMVEQTQLVGASVLVSRTDALTKRGYLLLLVDAASSQWRKKWFVLRRPFLQIFEDSNESDPIGIIGLDGVKIEHDKSLHGLFEQTHVFTLFTSANSYALAALNGNEHRDWIAKLDPTGIAA